MFIDVDNYERADIKALYSGAKVLVTGASGFLGKVLIEFLLRKTAVQKIYVLLRCKKNKSVAVRLKEILECTIFDNLREISPDRLHAVTSINGDVILPGLGLSENDKCEILNEVEVIFHGAAALSFNEKLPDAAEINVYGTRSVLDLAKEVKHLKVFMHISTAFTHCYKKEIEEKLYPIESVVKFWKTSKKLDFGNMNEATNSVMQRCPNTYIYTKLLAEQMLLELYSDLPVGIFRPGVVIGGVQEPVPGWVDNLYGPTGLAIGVMSGVVHATLIRRDCKADVVPVDLVVNCLISATWDTYSKFIINGPESSHIPVYNVVPSAQSAITWGQILDGVLKEGRAQPPSTSVWFPFCFATSSMWTYRLVTLVCHYLPAYIADILAFFSGRKVKWTRLYKKVDDITAVLVPFSTRQWEFKNYNVQSLWKNMSDKEKELFPFDFERLNWNETLPIYLKGVKKYVIKDKSTTEDNTKAKRLYFLHYSLISTVVIIGLALIYYIIPC